MAAEVHAPSENMEQLRQQIELWQENAQALELISSIQSEIIDKEFVIKQQDKITHLETALDTANSQTPADLPQDADISSLSEFNITVDRVNMTEDRVNITEDKVNITIDRINHYRGLS